MTDKTDLRIIKTNKVLFDALLQLMKEKTFEEIKVSDICNKALVNRSTFYAHFNDKYELLVAMLEETKLNLLNSLKKNDNNINTKQYFREMCELLLTHIEDKRNVYTEILVNNRNSILMDIIFDAANKDISERIENDKSIISNKVPIEIISKFYLGAIVSIGAEWIRNNNKYTKEQLLEYFDILIPNNI